MGSAQASVSVVEQDISNQLLQSVSASCASNGTNIISGNTIISKCPQGVKIKQTASSSTDCVLTTIIENAASTILKSAVEQSQSSQKSWLDAPLSAQMAGSYVSQDVENVLSQVVSSQCSANSTNITRDNLIICEGTSGGISIEQDASAVAKCVIQNSARQTVANDVSSSVKQDQTVSSIFTWFAAMMIVMVIGGLLVFFFFFKRSGGSSGGGGSPIIINASPDLYDDYYDPPSYDDIDKGGKGYYR